jgi:outer membrane immunogenic protein
MRRLSPGLLAVIAVAASAVATAASAADMPAPGPAPAYTPPVYRPVLYDWTGIYVGGNVGGGWMNDTVTTTTTTILQPAGTQTKLAPMGILGGVQAGFNVEFSPVVFGFEGTWLATNLSGSRITPSPLPGGISETSTSAAPWLATVAGRIGIAANDFLLYAKGGAAWMRVDYTQLVTAGVPLTLQTLNATRTGYDIGAGVEFGMTENLSAKLEYDYLGFGTKTYTFTGLSAPVAGVTTPFLFPVSVKSTLQMMTVGINYRFNWSGGGAVPAKY